MSSASHYMHQCKYAELVKPVGDLGPNNSLAALYEIAWKVQDESALFHQKPVQRDECKMRNARIPEYMTILKWEHDTPFLRLRDTTGILIRDAHHRMLQAIESVLWPKAETDESSDAAMEVDLDLHYNPFKTSVIPAKEVQGVIVSGGPGIGKSMFMVHVLTLCLLAHQSVVWQTKKERVLVFVKEGVYSALLDENLFHYIPNGAFYLADCNPQCLFPNIELMVNLIKLKGAKLLYFASLRQQNFAPFTKYNMLPSMLFMEQCTPEDLICCRLLWDKSISEQQLEEFIKLYGLSARNAFMYAKHPDLFAHEINNKTNALTMQIVLDAVSRRFGTFRLADNNQFDSHDIFSIQPSPMGRHLYTMGIHTRFIYDKVMQHMWRLERRSATELFRVFCSNSQSRACAEYIIKDWVIGKLPQGGEWRLKTMEVSTSRNKKLSYWHDVENGGICYFRVGYQGTATLTDERIDTQQGPNAVPTFSYNTGNDGRMEALPETDGIGLPVKGNQPTHDLFVWLAGEKRAIMVQVTVSPKHSIVKKGLEQLKKAGAQHLDLIVVTPVLTGRDIMSVYTEVANKHMLERVYHLSVTDNDMERIPEPPSYL